MLSGTMLGSATNENGDYSVINKIVTIESYGNDNKSYLKVNLDISRKNNLPLNHAYSIIFSYGDISRNINGSLSISKCRFIQQEVYKIIVHVDEIVFMCDRKNITNVSMNELFATPIAGISNLQTFSVAKVMISSTDRMIYAIFKSMNCAKGSKAGNLSNQVDELSHLISLKKPTSSTAQAGTGIASAVVNGDTSGMWSKNVGKFCSQELMKNMVNWLSLHLLGEFRVTDVIIYQVDNEINCDVYRYKYLSGGVVTVDGKQCGNTITDDESEQNKILIKCADDVFGSIVNFTNTGKSKSITFCELEVYGYHTEKYREKKDYKNSKILDILYKLELVNHFLLASSLILKK